MPLSRHHTLSLPAAIHAGDSPVLALCGTLPAGTGEIALTSGQRLALLQMRGNDLSDAVLRRMIAIERQGPQGRDFYALGRLGLAINKGRFHVLTDSGRFRADHLALDFARATGMHIVTYDYGGWHRTPRARCCCGWVSYRSRAIPSYVILLSRDASHHREHVVEQ